MASKVILGTDSVIGRQEGRERKRVQDFTRGFYGPGLEREYITCTHIPFSHSVLQPELTQRSWKICSSFVSRMKAGLVNNQAASEILTLPTLILGGTGLLSGFALSWRPFASCILAQSPPTSGSQSTKKQRAQTLYAKAGLTLKVEFAGQPSLLFVPKEPALHWEFLLHLKLGGHKSGRFTLSSDRSPCSFPLPRTCSRHLLNLGEIYKTIQNDLNFIFLKCGHLWFYKD